MIRRVKLVILILVAGLFRVNTLSSQTLPSGPQVLTFYSDIDDTEQPYGLYLPKNFNPNKKYPLVIMLHGAGSNHRLSLRRVFGKSNEPGATDVETSRIFPPWEDVDFIVASPYARGTAGYQGVPEKDVYDVLKDVKKRFQIDNDRVYLTGLSMGGGGTLWIGLTHPDLWAAIAPVCPAPPIGTEVFAPNALNFPVHFFQGGADPVVNPEGTRKWVSDLKNLGTKVEYTEYPGVQHNSWEKAYQDGYIFQWFKNYKRNLYPDTVRFATNRYKYNSAYWVTIDRFLPGATAEIEAVYHGNQTLNINTKQLDGFTLQLAKHPRYNSLKKMDIVVDGQLISLQAQPVVSFFKNNGKWNSGVVSSSGLVKHPGQEGPIFDAFSSRHIYVYGTKDSPSPELLQSRMNVALQAANWSVYRGEFLGRMMFFPRVISDKEVRPSDIESANLILFGTSETNSLIPKDVNISLALNNTGQNEYGLLYIYPNNGHYIVVSSGLPWWAGVEDKGYPFLPPAVRGLSQFKDYMLFKGSVKNILAEGYFDNGWKLSGNQKEALLNSGAGLVITK